MTISQLIENPYLLLAMSLAVLVLTLPNAWRRAMVRGARSLRRRVQGPRPYPNRDGSRAPNDVEKSGKNPSAPKPYGSAEQLEKVINAAFSARPVLNGEELVRFNFINDILADDGRGHRLMAQVNLGSFLSSPCADGFTAVNSKRVDMLVIDGEARAKCAIEYQGSGHYQQDAAIRDAIKKEALRRAGVPFVEITTDHTRAQVRRLVLDALGPKPS